MRNVGRAWVGVVVAALAGALPGCESDVEIVGECTLEGESAPVPVPDGEAVRAIGMIGDHVLVTTVQRVEWADERQMVAVRSHWLDRDFQRVGEPIEHGIARAAPIAGRVRWVRVGDALMGRMWVDPEGYVDDPTDLDTLHVWTMRPPPAAELSSARVVLDAWRRTDGTGDAYDDGGAHSSLDEALVPGTAINGAFASPVISSPLACELGRWTLFWIHGSEAGISSTPIALDGELCEGGRPLAPSQPWTISLPDGDVGLAYRVDDASGGHVRWARVSANGQLRALPSVVGAHSPFQQGFGAQPRAIAFDDGNVVLAERPLLHGRCRSFRVFRTDGTDVHDGPWKLPCAEERETGDFDVSEPVRMTQALELERIADRGALLVYSDTANPVFGDDASTNAIRATLLTSRGQRGSALVTVSDPGPVGGSVNLVTDGEEAVVGWATDEGPRLRRLRCSLE